MHFERLDLQNFASYFGEHSLDLTSTPERPVIIVLGSNGFGKTSIFDGLNWALYGGSYEMDLEGRRGRKIIDYINETALGEAADSNNEVTMACTLSFEHDGIHYYITQSLSARAAREPSGNIKVVQTQRETALYEIAVGGNHKRKEYDTIFLDEILPNNVKDFFLFDGDRIYDLSSPGSSQEVRNAIYRVVDLELIQNAITHLSDVAKEFRKEVKKEAAGELGEVEELYANARKRLDDLKQEKINQEGEEAAVKSQIELLEEKLSNLPDTTKLQSRRTEIVTQAHEAEIRQDRLTGEMRGYCATASLGLARDHVLGLAVELDSKRERGHIPKSVSETLLKDLLKLHRCLCDTEFEEGDRIYQVLVSKLEFEKTRSSGQELLGLLFQLQSASELVTDAVGRLDNADKEYHELAERRRSLDIALKQVDTELDNLPKEDVAAIAEQLRDRRGAIIAVNRKLQKLAEDLSRTDSEIRELEKKRGELGKKQAAARKLQLRESLAQRAAERLEDIYQTFAEESRRAVETLTKQEFAKFVKSSAGYEVELSEDYELQVLDSHGNRALQRLSMGQAQCLSLSFITSISRVSEKDPPLVIDMPFGRLDPDVHNQISSRLPEISSQLILFLLPGVEWNAVTERNLKPKASHIYELSFDEKYRRTTVTEKKGRSK